MKKLNNNLKLSFMFLLVSILLISMTSFASTMDITYEGQINKTQLNTLTNLGNISNNNSRNESLLKGDGLHNSVYARRVNVYAHFITSEGEQKSYSFTGSEKVFNGNNEFGLINISQATKVALEQAGAQDNMTLVGWIIVPQFQVFSDKPISITYNYYGISNKTEGISEGDYSIQYYVPLGETNGRFSGYLTFTTSTGKVSTSQFVMGAELPAA